MNGAKFQCWLGRPKQARRATYLGDAIKIYAVTSRANPPRCSIFCRESRIREKLGKEERLTLTQQIVWSVNDSTCISLALACHRMWGQSPTLSLAVSSSHRQCTVGVLSIALAEIWTTLTSQPLSDYWRFSALTSRPSRIPKPDRGNKIFCTVVISRLSLRKYVWRKKR